MSAAPLLCLLAALPPFWVGYFHLPAEQTAVIKVHLEHIVMNGWGIVEPGELFHGHILMSPRARGLERFRSFEHLVENSYGVLYHSDEHMGRWTRESGLPVAWRTPRSFVAYWDGRVVPAATLLKDPSLAPDYEKFGTIHALDLEKQLPAFIWGRRRWEVLLGDVRCLVNLQFDFGPGRPPDPLTIVGGKPQMMTMDCIDPREYPP